MSNSNSDPSLSITDVAKRLNMSENFVYRQAISGALQHYAIGGTARKCGAIRFSEIQYLEYLEGQKRLIPKALLSNSNKVELAKRTADKFTVTYKLNKLLKQKQA